MAVPASTVIEVMRGDSATLVFDSEDAAGVAVAIGTAWMTVKASLDDADSAKIFGKSTTIAAQGSVYGNGTQCEFYLIPGDYAGTGTGIANNRPYYFDCQVKGTNSKVTTVARGTFYVRGDVTTGTT